MSLINQAKNIRKSLNNMENKLRDKFYPIAEEIFLEFCNIGYTKNNFIHYYPELEFNERDGYVIKYIKINSWSTSDNGDKEEIFRFTITDYFSKEKYLEAFIMKMNTKLAEDKTFETNKIARNCRDCDD